MYVFCLLTNLVVLTIRQEAAIGYNYNKEIQNSLFMNYEQVTDVYGQNVNLIQPIEITNRRQLYNYLTEDFASAVFNP